MAARRKSPTPAKTKKPSTTIGFVGGGNMAEALIRGLRASLDFSRSAILVSDVVVERLTHLKSSYGIEPKQKNADVAKSSDVIILAVKPNTISSVLTEIKAAARGKLLISIAAGVPARKLKAPLEKDARIIRVMPNNPAMVGAGITAVYADPAVSKKDRETARRIFEAVGRVAFIESEPLMNAVTGLSGSGPAFVYIVAESLSDAGVTLGLPRETANLLSFRTLLGAARMLEETGIHPAELKNRVTSPGGTTIAGIERLEALGLRSALIEAVAAAARRSRELEGG